MDIEVTTKKRRVSVKRIVIPVAVVLIVSGLAFGAYRMYKDEQAITRINNDLYAVRKDFYDGNYYGKDNFYSLSELVQENWKPTYSLVSQTVEKKSVLDQNATYEKQ
ncbi:MAG TPA: hypothetical protein PKD15_04755, partial [Candidatus Saccharibacteria bacterium]|nr:hypothetical protein [Candidatus Saccharibacteria bacterium]